MKTRLYLDMDRTFYDTDRMFKPIQEDLLAMGFTLQEIEQTEKTLVPGGYSYERHLELLGVPADIAEIKCRAYYDLLDRGGYLYPEVEQRLAGFVAMGVELALLTFGFPDFQKRKFNALAAIQPYFHHKHFVWLDQTKGELIKLESESNPGMRTVFADDTVTQLLDVKLKSPETVLAHMWRYDTPRPEMPEGCTPINTLDDLVPLLTSISEEAY